MKNMMRSGVLALAMMVGAQGAVIVQYGADGGTFAATAVAGGVTAGALDDTGSAGDLQAGSAMADVVYLNSVVAGTTAADAIASNQYFQFTVGPAGGYLLSLGSLTMEVGRGGEATPRGWVLTTSVDGFASEIATEQVPTVQPTLTGFTVDLSGAAFQGLSGATTFRIYQYSTGGSGTGLFYDNITLNGTVEKGLGEVPEPGTAALALMGLAAAAWLKRR